MHWCWTFLDSLSQSLRVLLSFCISYTTTKRKDLAPLASFFSPQNHVTCFIEHKYCEARINTQSLLSSTLGIDVVQMSEMDKGLGKPCTHCARTIHGANYFCSSCKAWYCLLCGIYELRGKCPKCGGKLE